jgi:hypothetical protein
VQDDPGRINPGRQGDRQFAVGADADSHTIVDDPAGDLRGQQ